MKNRPLKNQKGTTLIELIVCMVLLAIFCSAVVVLIKPFTNVFLRSQQINHAQTVADSVAEDLTGRLLHARGPVEISEGKIEFTDEKGYVKVIDADEAKIDEIRLPSKGQAKTADGKEGTLHERYYVAATRDADEANRSCEAYADFHDDNFYMGNTVGISFEGVPAADAARLKALKVTIAVYDESDQVIFTRKALIELVELPQKADG